MSGRGRNIGYRRTSLYCIVHFKILGIWKSSSSSPFRSFFCGWWYYYGFAVVIFVVVVVILMLGDRGNFENLVILTCRSTSMRMIIPAVIDWKWAAASRTSMISSAGVLTYY